MKPEQNENGFALFSFMLMIQVFFMLLKFAGISGLTWQSTFVPTYLYVSMFIGALAYTLLKSWIDKKNK